MHRPQMNCSYSDGDSFVTERLHILEWLLAILRCMTVLSRTEKRYPIISAIKREAVYQARAGGPKISEFVHGVLDYKPESQRDY
jgi:hypothetical protein